MPCTEPLDPGNENMRRSHQIHMVAVNLAEPAAAAAGTSALNEYNYLIVFNLAGIQLWAATSWRPTSRRCGSQL